MSTCINCSEISTSFVTIRKGRLRSFCDKHANECGVLKCPHCGERHPTTIGAEKWKQEHACTQHRELVEHAEDTIANRHWWARQYPKLSHNHADYLWCWKTCTPDHYHPCLYSCTATHDHENGEACYDNTCTPCPGCGGHMDKHEFDGLGCSRHCAYGRFREYERY